MTKNTNPPEKQVTQLTSTTNNNPQAETKNKSVSINKNKLLTFFTCLALIIALAANYQIYQTQKNNAVTINSLQEANKKTVFIINQQRQDLTKTKAALQKQLTALQQNIAPMLAEPLYQNQNWLMFKAKYLLELAQINSYWSNDFQTTAALLNQADLLLSKLNQPQILPVRQALAAELIELHKLTALDIPGLLSKLDALQTVIKAEPLQLLSQSEHPSVKQSAALSWRDKLKESFMALEKLVVIKRIEQNEDPVFSHQHKLLLSESVIFNLQQAQWGLMQYNADIYQQALAQALKIINRIYAANSADAQALIKQITVLQQVALSVQKPNLELSLQLLNKVIANASADLPKLASPAAKPKGDTPQ